MPATGYARRDIDLLLCPPGSAASMGVSTTRHLDTRQQSAQQIPDHADRTRDEESLRSMSGFAVILLYALLDQAVGWRHLALCVSTNTAPLAAYQALLLAAFDSPVAKGRAC